MILNDPCRDCGTPNAYLCADCTRASKKKPVCTDCCPHKEQRMEKGNAWSCGTNPPVDVVKYICIVCEKDMNESDEGCEYCGAVYHEDCFESNPYYLRCPECYVESKAYVLKED